jgi:hypothetical protein
MKHKYRLLSTIKTSYDNVETKLRDWTHDRWILYVRLLGMHKLRYAQWSVSELFGVFVVFDRKKRKLTHTYIYIYIYI